MDKELLRNGSGYVDFTAYSAIRNCLGERKMDDIKRGEIYEYETSSGTTRYVLVVSSDERKGKRFLNGILLSENDYGNETVAVACHSLMYASCEEVSLCARDKFREYVRSVNADTMKDIDAGILRALGLEVEKPVEIVKEIIKEVPVQAPTTESNVDCNYYEEFVEAKAEANVYRNMYEKLLGKVMG